VKVSLSNLKKENEDLCVKLHMESYPDYLFTSRFSEKLLGKFYSKLIENCEHNYLIQWDDRPVGLIIAGRNSKSARNSFIRDNLASLIIVLIKNPKFLIKKLLGVFAKSHDSKYKLRFLNLLVTPEYQSKPITINAVKLFEEKLRENNEKTYGHSVQSGNIKTINFHIKNGCRIETIKNDAVFFFKNI
jgi:hypothetical protein